MRYFTNCKCIEDVKEQYHKLIKQYHPDVNQEDTTEAMKQINDEYKQLHKKFKNIHRAENGGTYEAKQQTTETPEEFIEALKYHPWYENETMERCREMAEHTIMNLRKGAK